MYGSFNLSYLRSWPALGEIMLWWRSLHLLHLWSCHLNRWTPCSWRVAKHNLCLRHAGVRFFFSLSLGFVIFFCTFLNFPRLRINCWKHNMMPVTCSPDFLHLSPFPSPSDECEGTSNDSSFAMVLWNYGQCLQWPLCQQNIYFCW